MNIPKYRAYFYRRNREKLLAVVIVISLVGLTGWWGISQMHVKALDGSQFNAGRIIDDGIFYNKDAMSADEIRLFLNNLVPNCDTMGTKPSEYGSGSRADYGTSRGAPPPYTCVKDYWQNPQTGEDNYGGKPIPAGAKSSAQIIYDAAQQYGINPRTLLVLIKKEAGGNFLEDEWPWLTQYRTATGYGCPDSGPNNSANCDAGYYGFSNQVINAARQFRLYANNPNDYNYVAGQNNYIQYNPQASCGGRTIFIENHATAALYNYTPYTPNQAALSNLYGTGDGCSAYGNRNFWRIFNDWFGNTSVSGRVYIKQFSNITDSDGESAKLGFSLNQRPTHPVTVLLNVSNGQTAGIVGNVDRVVIQPDKWDRPDLNIITLYGKNDGTNESAHFSVVTSEVSSYDPQFDLLIGDDVGDVSMINQAGQHKVYRLYAPSINKHVFTSRKTELDYLKANGYQDEGVAFYSCVGGEKDVIRLKKGTTTLNIYRDSDEYASALGNGFTEDVPQFALSSVAQVPVYRLWNASKSDYIYTTSAGERDYIASQHNYTYEGVGLYTCRQGQEPVYRLYSQQRSSHFFTSSPAERDTAGAHGYGQEGVGFYIDSSTANLPVYRLYNASRKSHFYTTSDSEKNAAASQGFSYEGVGFKVDDAIPANLPIYRLYNPSRGNHFYTLGESEKQTAIASGYQYEGIGFKISP